MGKHTATSAVSHDDYDRFLYRMSQLALRTGTYLDLWWFYESFENRRQFQTVFNRYRDFIRFDSHAHLAALLVHLFRFFENRKDSMNLGELVRQARTLGLPNKTAERCESIISAARGSKTFEGVKLLRHKIFGHRDLKKDYADLFKDANLTQEDLQGLLDEVLNVINVCALWRGKRETVHLSDAVDTLRALMSDLSSE